MKNIGKYLVATFMAFNLLLPATALAADTVNPGDVEEVTATAMNASVKLNWVATTDDVGVAGYTVYYGLTPVTKSGQTYDSNVDVGNVKEYTVTGLSNNSKYYFSVIAYDAAGNESLNWSPEVSATPSAGAGSTSDDKIAPQVAKAEASYVNEVKVTFTEAVVLPSKDPQDSFTIENDDTLEPLVVLDAELDAEDTSGKTVILTTDDQTKDQSYTLTVGIDVKDAAGNFIISGTSDTATFDGTDDAKSAGADDAFKMLDAEASDETHILINFNKTMVLSIDPAEDFVITEKDDDTATLEILKVDLGENEEGVEDASVLIEVSEPMADTDYVIFTKVTDEFGATVAEEDNNLEFAGAVAEEDDTTPPLDVTDFVAKAVFEAGKYIVNLSWKQPSENEGDVDEQVLYMSKDDQESYDENDTFDGDAVSGKLEDMEPGEYWLKLTEKDAAGNESEGVAIKVVLSETGPEMLGLALVSVLFGKIFGKKKRK